MSRTIRRKNALHRVEGNATHSVRCWRLGRDGLLSPETLAARCRARFHADSRSGLWGIPHWFLHLENGKHKRRNAQELRRCWAMRNWESHSLVPFKHTSFYYNW